MRVDKTKWQKTTIAEIGKIITGATPPTKITAYYNSADVCFFKPGDLGNTSITCLDSSADYISNLGYENSRKLPIGTVLVTCIGIIGKVGITSVLSTCNQQINAIICNENFHNRFIAYNILYNKDYFASKANGPVVPLINKTTFSQFVLNVPISIEEQLNIAKELDAIQTMIDGYKAHISDFDELAKSLFLDTLGDPVINEKKWQIKSLSSLCNKMSTGPFGSMLHKSDYVVEGIPSVNPQNIKGSKVVIDGIAKVSYQKAEELSKYYLKENDIILARRGDLSKCAIITPKEQGWLCGTGSFFLHIEEVLPIVFYYQFTSKSIQKQLLEKSIGATMPNLNQGILSKLMIPVPPIDIQQKFASQIEAIEKQKAILCEQLADAEQLMAERMQYYFS